MYADGLHLEKKPKMADVRPIFVRYPIKMKVWKDKGVSLSKKKTFPTLIITAQSCLVNPFNSQECQTSKFKKNPKIH